MINKPHSRNFFVLRVQVKARDLTKSFSRHAPRVGREKVTAPSLFFPSLSSRSARILHSTRTIAPDMPNNNYRNNKNSFAQAQRAAQNTGPRNSSRQEVHHSRGTHACEHQQHLQLRARRGLPVRGERQVQRRSTRRARVFRSDRYRHSQILQAGSRQWRHAVNASA